MTAFLKFSLRLRTSALAATLVTLACNTMMLQPATAASAASEADSRAIRDQAAAYSKAFAIGDFKTMAQMWAPDGTFTDSDGHDYKNRAEVENYFRSYFTNQAAPQKLDINIESIKFPAPNVAIEEGTTLISGGPRMGSKGHYVAVHTKNNGQWQMLSSSETNCAAGSTTDYLKDLDWLVGTWAIKDQPQAAHLKVSWSKNKTFLVCQYRSDDKSASLEQLQIIGWDPESRSIVTWHFGATGGFGTGHMMFDGKSWIERAAATEANGVTGSARYKLTQIDKDNFSWQSSERSREGKRLPDSNALTIVRDNSNVQ